MMWSSSRFSKRLPSPAALALAGLAASFVVSPGSAFADASSCTELHASGQREMRAGQLKTASKQFMTCSSDDLCPEEVRADCIRLYESVERRTPTVIFSVVNEEGQDVTNVVKVSSGENVLVESLDGRAVALDPGQHEFRFDLPWGEAVNLEVLIREGEKNRVVSIKVKDPNQPGAEVPVEPAAPVGPAPPVVVMAPNRTPAGFWVATGIGAAALGTGIVFEVLGYSLHSELADCSPTCDPARKDDYEAMKRNYLIGDIAIGAGLVSFGVAALIYFSSDSPAPMDSASLRRLPQVAIVPSRSGDGASVLISGSTF